ncbi:hypothetical protein E2R68_02625 [Psychromonas sp. RZ22]|uniref:hypothetical protein n=1 Tax=Psychromonas algarum TaxID=2555643 RepID=UPI001067407D|nr:hypothetical protein [Psychromonas sp. RZ22]TEW56005.1 hypothetical protein E2R68_02625 [Psychromonas sp. RZ22]
MKLHQRILPVFVISTFSLPSAAESIFFEDPYGAKNYMTVSAFLGTRISEDVAHKSTGEVADFSAALTQAVALGWTYDRHSEGELLFSNSKPTLSMSNSTTSAPDIDVYIQYLHFGGRVLFPTRTAFSSSFGLGIGATYFNPEGNDYGSEFAFSGNITGGIRYQLTEEFALRGDLRVYGTLLNSESSLFCGNQTCYLDVDGDVYVQGELMAGLEFKF